ANTNDQALQSAISVVDLATQQVQQVGSEAQTDLPININPVWIAHGTQVTFAALKPVNRDLGGTQRYWSAMIPSTTSTNDTKQVHIVAVSQDISHVIAAG